MLIGNMLQVQKQQFPYRKHGQGNSDHLSLDSEFFQKLSKRVHFQTCCMMKCETDEILYRQHRANRKISTQKHTFKGKALHLTNKTWGTWELNTPRHEFQTGKNHQGFSTLTYEAMLPKSVPKALAGTWRTHMRNWNMSSRVKDSLILLNMQFLFCHNNSSREKGPIFS